MTTRISAQFLGEFDLSKAKSLWGHDETPETDKFSSNTPVISTRSGEWKEFARDLERQRDYWKDKCNMLEYDLMVMDSRRS